MVVDYFDRQAEFDMKVACVARAACVVIVMMREVVVHALCCCCEIREMRDENEQPSPRPPHQPQRHQRHQLRRQHHHHPHVTEDDHMVAVDGGVHVHSVGAAVVKADAVLVAEVVPATRHSSSVECSRFRRRDQN